MEEKKDNTQDQPKNETIEAVKEEFDKKIAEMQESHKKELEALKKSHVDEIRALIAGSKAPSPKEEEKTPENDEPFEPNKLYENLKKKFKI